MKQNLEQKDKYYIPDISEFHVGFELELYILPDKIWTSSYIDKEFKVRFLNSYLELDDLNKSNSSNIRVKYLDKEDIESLGWYPLHVLKLDSEEFIEGWEIEDFIMYIEENTIVIYKRDDVQEFSGNWTEKILFQGKLKNKSELKRLMNQLNIS